MMRIVLVTMQILSEKIKKDKNFDFLISKKYINCSKWIKYNKKVVK